MRSKFFFFFLIFVVLFLNTSFCEEVSLKELIQHPKSYQGKEVEIYGEAIGDIMKRKDSFWMNVCEGGYCIGVFGKDLNLVKSIEYTGKYKQRGDWVKIKGVFNYPCREHLGDTDIHAHSIEIVFKGEKFPEDINYGKIVLSFFLLGGLFLLWILRRFEKTSI